MFPMIFIFTNAKTNPMSQKFLISIFFLLFTCSALVLFWQSDRELDPNQGKNWWTLSFAVPEQKESLSFIVENHSDQTQFEYTISVGKNVILRELFTAPQREKTTVTPPSIIPQSERVKISVSAGNDKKEIYR